MPNETAINRLLYAILSQKCLKDIDWNKVANDPVLKKEITNGHAARMRYSRFKKQMEGGTAGVSRKPRNPNSPRKYKPKKNGKPDQNAKTPTPEHQEGENFKAERAENEGYPAEMSMGGARLIKREPTERENKYMPGTPFTLQSQNSTPSPGTSLHDFGFMGIEFGEMDPMDNMATSFGGYGGGGDGFYPHLIGHDNFGSGMGTPIDDSSLYHDEMLATSWQHQEGGGVGMRGERRMADEDGVPVKTEQRWDAEYRHT